ncbi:hypothetical protein GCM10007079_21760 [Nocardiopsis terrae]|nr:hypothetical protein GCM10007079_21760 [Nocardiopsis terrae]
MTVEYGYRVIAVRLGDDGWARSVPGEPDSAVVIARQGNEETLARQLARELLDRLP